MNPDQIKQLDDLRQSLLRHNVWDTSTLSSFFRDYLQNRQLCDALINNTFIEEVAYCGSHKTDRRDDLIALLYQNFTQAGKSCDKALSLTSIALYLAGIDSTLTKVEEPNPGNVTFGWLGGGGKNNGGGSGGGINSGGSGGSVGGNVGGNIGGNSGGGNNGNNGGKGGGTSSKPFLKRLLSKWRMLLVVSVILVAVFFSILLVVHKTKNNMDNQKVSVSDLCRVYEGKITTENGEKICKLSVHVVAENEVSIIVTNIYDPSDVVECSGKVRNGKLLVSQGPNLEIETLTKGRIVLDGGDKRHGRWRFHSQ